MANLKYLVLFFPLFFLFGCAEKEKAPAVNEQQELNNFLFVGKSGKGSALFNYSLADSSYKKIWEENREKIVELNYSDDRDWTFLITANDFGKRGAFPSIKKIKLYFVNPVSLNVELIKELGDGLQIFTNWESGNNFKIVINSFNKTNANFIEQQTLVFSKSGKVNLDEMKTFDLTNDGYPNLPSKQQQTSNNNYSLIKDGNAIFLSYKNDKKKSPILETSFEISGVEWSADNNYLIFSAINISPENKSLYSNDPQTSTLILFSLHQKKIIKRWDGAGFKSFFVQKKYLVFDNGFGENSSIKIFNINSLNILDMIKIKGGCGLKSIPQTPDFSA